MWLYVTPKWKCLSDRKTFLKQSIVSILHLYLVLFEISIAQKDLIKAFYFWPHVSHEAVIKMSPQNLLTADSLSNISSQQNDA